MNRPIRNSMVATLLFAPPAYTGSVAGAAGVLIKLLAVFFLCVFLGLMGLHLFYNRKWRIDPGPQWRWQSHSRRSGMRGAGYLAPR